MDKNNMLDISPKSIGDLEKDFKDWCNLPYSVKAESDEECIAKYGISNLELYEILKCNISQKIESDDLEQSIQKYLSEGVFISDNEEAPDFYSGEEEYEFLWRLQMAENLEVNPNVVIISPFKNKDVPDYGLLELDNKYGKYLSLIDKYKRFSDSYSMSLWGYNVHNMYNIMKGIILNNTNVSDDNIVLYKDASKKDSPVFNLKESVDQMIVDDDKLGLYRVKIDSCCSEMTAYHKSIYNGLDRKIDKALNEVDFNSVVCKAVPYFTIDEAQELLSEKDIIRLSSMDNDKYTSLLFEASKIENITERENALLSLAWNPSVEVNNENLEFARQRQIKWLQNKAPKIVDIRNLSSIESLNESTASMRRLYKEKNLYPLYIVLSFTYTPLGKIIRVVKRSKYSHAGLATDSNLQNITTFKFGAEWNGFSVESIDDYINTSHKALLNVLCIFVDKSTRDKIDRILKDFVAKQDKTSYGFGNLFNILFNKAKDNDPENLYMVCSQFVDTVLRLANINLFDKSSNLVTPGDFYEICSNPKIYNVFEGLATDYLERSVEGSIYNLLRSKDVKDIRYNEVINIVKESNIEGFYAVTENDKCNKILEEVRELLTPEAVIYEKKFPLGINDKGDLTIELYKKLEDEYQEAHRLLKQYGENNIEGIKHELARLFYINTVLEKKIKKFDKDDPKYKKSIDLRARVLNDFKKYFKIVLEKEPDFDFTEYFKKSEYYNGNIIIDNRILRFTGKLIEKFLKSLGM